jgi:hypothetical protein
MENFLPISLIVLISSIMICGYEGMFSMIPYCFCAFFAALTFNYIIAIKVTLHPATGRALKIIEECFKASALETPEREEDDLMVDTSGDKPEIKVRQGRRIQYATKVALQVKGELGLLTYCEANRLIYQRACLAKMKKHNVRTSHIAHILPMAVGTCFKPLDSDFLGASIAVSSECKELRARIAACRDM